MGHDGGVTTSNSPAERFDHLRRECWDRALAADGTAKLFELRARRLNSRLTALSFAGFAIPIVVGGVVAIGATVSALSIVLIVSSALGLLQLVWSLWSLISRWSEKSSHAVQSMMTNRQLAEGYSRLATAPPVSLGAFEAAYGLIEVQDSAQRNSDLSQQISQQEKRFGMHSALLGRQKACAGCTIVPRSLKPTDCGVCGDYPKRWAR
ncbi:mobilome CxxCx(11)CxxC protein [Rhodococcus sp. NPDC057297]|uniref:mobilome CxxCx(11)CxxC protein n=1 Tax=Rhodococcus sp. NPDC057297 TaxID=3346090 RepID=UPI00364328EA